MSKPQNRTFFKKCLRILMVSVIGFFVSTIAVTVLYRWVNPFATPLMLIRIVDQVAAGKKPGMDYRWRDLDQISSNLQLCVIASEDNLFESHNGIDMKAIEKAQKSNEKGKKLRGGSTISQQTAKNVFLTPSRTWLRKGLELYFTGLIELFWGKERIMEVYLNVIEMGDGIYGAEAASQTYYKKKASQLSRAEAAGIAAILPSPRRWHPTKSSNYIQGRKSRIIQNSNNINYPDWLKEKKVKN